MNNSMEQKTENELKLIRANKLSLNYYWHDFKTYGFTNPQKIDKNWIVDNGFTECIYCGETDWRKLGLDRINNSKPHTEDNVVPCCRRCNIIRGNRFTVDEMKEIGAVIRRIEERDKKYFINKGKKVASFDIDGNKVKEYPCAKQVQEDGYNPRIVRRACEKNKEGYRYKGYYWKYI